MSNETALVISLVGSVFIDLMVAGLVRFWLKPKQEEVFEKNRKKAIQVIFNVISRYDESKMFIFNEVEKNLVPPSYREEIMKF